MYGPLQLGMTTKYIPGGIPEPNPFWQVFSALIEFEFSPILKHEYETGNGDIGTHPEPIPKPVPNVENQFTTPFI
jgi:hypothetical protein